MTLPDKNIQIMNSLVASAPNLGSDTETGSWKFRLYIAGSAPHSRLAITNLKAFGDQFLAGKYTIEIVDVLKEPLRTLDDGVYVTPTLVRLFPEPVCRIIGNLSDEKPILAVLGIMEATNG